MQITDMLRQVLNSMDKEVTGQKTQMFVGCAWAWNCPFKCMCNARAAIRFEETELVWACDMFSSFIKKNESVTENINFNSTSVMEYRAFIEKD